MIATSVNELGRAGCVAVGAFFYFSMTIALGESTAILSLATAKAVLLGGIPALMVVWLFQLADPVELRDTMSFLRASSRWSAHRCPNCAHPMPPDRFDGPCTECGVPFCRPRPASRRARERVVAGLVALAIGCGAAQLWLWADVSAFRAEVAANPSVRYARDRWWPVRSAGLTYSPEDGVRAHD